MESVKDLSVGKKMTVASLMEQMGSGGGFTAKKLKEGSDIMKEMIKDKGCFKFLSFPACIISTGARGVIKDMVKNKMVDAVITTCGTLDHDLARVWQDYYHGDFSADDSELRKKGINRLGNIFIPNSSYGEVLEEKLIPVLQTLYDKGEIRKEISTRELIWKVGEAIKDEKKAEESITYWCWKNRIPVFVPGITDGSFGSQCWFFWQDGHKDFIVNVMMDEQELSDIVFNHEKTGALMLGGGISKHHVIWWNQFKGGLDYAVYITTAPEWDGSLSGARLREAISWGKLKSGARRVDIEGDATVLLPLLIGSVIE